MAGKQLSILVKAVDQAGGVLRSVQAQTINVGVAADKADAKTSTWLGRMISGAFSLKGLLAGVVGGLSVGALVSGFNSAARELDDLNDTAQRLGVSTELLSELKYAAQLSGVEFGSLAESVATADKRILQFIQRGTGKGAEALRRLNVPLVDGAGNVREMTELLPELADAISSLEDPAQRLAAAEGIFGSTSFLQVIGEGASGLRAAAAEAKKLGVVFGPATVNAAARYSDAVDRVKMAWLGLRARVVEELGPDLADLGNRLAGVIAAVPQIVSKGVASVRAYMAGDQSVAREVEAIARSVVNIGGVLIERGIATLTVVGFQAFRAGLAALRGPITAELHKFMAAVQFEFIKGQERIFSLAFGADPTGLGKRITDSLLGYTDALQKANELFLDVAVYPVDKIGSAYQDAFSELTRGGRMITDVWSGVGTQIGPMVSDIGQRLDGLLGVTDALAQHAIEAADAITRKAAPASDAAAASTWKWSNAVDGLEQGWKNVKTQALDALSWGREAAETVANGIGANLTGAMIDAVAGVKSLKEAFRDFASNTLRMISEVITKMLVMRALVSIGGSIFGGATTAGADAGIAGPSYFATFARTGGVFVPRGFEASLPHFAAGGMVDGLRVGRDNRFAMLAAGEGVLNAAAVARSGEAAVHYANAGGRLVPDRGTAPISITVAPTIVVQGGTADSTGAASVRRAVAQGVIEALAANPAARARLREVLRA